MGEEDAVSRKPESVVDGNTKVEEKMETLMNKKEEQDVPITEKEDKKDNEVEGEAQHMDVDKEEVIESAEGEDNVEDKVAEEGAKEDEKEEVEARDMDVDNEEVVHSNEVDNKVGYEKVAEEGEKADETEAEDVKVAEEGEKGDEKEAVAEKVAEGEKGNEKEAKDDKVAEAEIGDENEEDEKVAEGEKGDQKRDEKEADDEKVAEVEKGEDDENLAEVGKKEDVKEGEDENVAEEGEKEEEDKVAEEGKKENEKEEDEQKVAEEDEQEDTKAYQETKVTVGGVVEKSKSSKMECDIEKITKNETEVKIEEKIDGVIAKEEKLEEPKVGKGTKRPRAKSGTQKSDTGKTKNTASKKEKESETPSEKKEKDPETPTGKKEKEPKTPTLPTPATVDRPVRERKSVERLVAIIEKDSAKDFHIEKGRGTALKDIPKVAYKLSRKKNEDTLKLLHTILFTRRGKAAEIKNNISRFSGFVWHDNEEKQTMKVKEKLDKCVKEKLMDFCDILDIPISRTHSRKEDIIAKLIEFLLEPHANSSEFLEEKDQSSKGKKRKRDSGSAPGSSTTPLKGSSKSRKKTKSTPKKGGEMKSSQSESDESEEDKHEMHEDKDVNGVRVGSDDEMSEQAKSEEKLNESEPDSDKDKGKKKQGSEKSSGKKGSSAKVKTKEVKISKKTSPPSKISLPKSPQSPPKKKIDMSAKKSSGKKKEESIKKSTSKKSASKESTGKKLSEVIEKPVEEKISPSDVELRNAITEILKEVNFDTATFTDILKLLVKQFDMDLTPRKSSIKSMIQDELTKLAGAEEDEDDAEKDEKKPSAKGVKT